MRREGQLPTRRGTGGAGMRVEERNAKCFPLKHLQYQRMNKNNTRRKSTKFPPSFREREVEVCKLQAPRC